MSGVQQKTQVHQQSRKDKTVEKTYGADTLESILPMALIMLN